MMWVYCKRTRRHRPEATPPGEAGGFILRSSVLSTMSTKAKLVVVFGFVVLAYFLVGGEAEPVEVAVETESD